MGNQQKKDAKRAKRKKVEKREKQLRTEQENIQHKQRLRDYFSFSIPDMVRRLAADGRVSAETALYQELKGDETFDEMQRRILTQVQLQANDPRGNHRVRPIPPRLYICKSAAAVATLYVSPAVMLRAGTALIDGVQAFYDLYAGEGGEISFACYVFGISGHPSAQHFAILAGKDAQLEVFIITDGKWMRLGSGEAPVELIAAMGKRVIERSDEAPHEDPFDDTICNMASGMVDDEDDREAWLEAYEEVASGSISAAEPIAGELLSRVEDWVTQQQHRIERLQGTLEDLSGDLEATRNRESDLSRELQRTSAQLAAATAALAAKGARAAAPASTPVRPLKERMAEIFLG